VCVIVQNVSKISHTVLKILHFLFSRWPRGIAILDFEILKCLVSHQVGGLRCIIVPNFIKIGRTAAEILHLTFFKMAAVRHLGFFKIDFFNITFGGQ